MSMEVVTSVRVCLGSSELGLLFAGVEVADAASLLLLFGRGFIMPFAFCEDSIVFLLIRSLILTVEEGEATTERETEREREGSWD